MAALSNPCDICVPMSTGSCLSNLTCRCYGGFAGPLCSDRMPTEATLAPAPRPQDNTANIIGIIAGVLGGCLLTLLIGFGLFVMWKRRFKRKAARTSSTNPSTAPVLVPALYNISTSDRSSLQSQTTTYHVYEEL